nr:hypothetical protein [Lysinibacillus timonensis]
MFTNLNYLEHFLKTWKQIRRIDSYEISQEVVTVNGIRFFNGDDLANFLLLIDKEV